MLQNKKQNTCCVLHQKCAKCYSQSEQSSRFTGFFDLTNSFFVIMDLTPIQTAEEVLNDVSARLYSAGNPTLGILYEYHHILPFEELLEETVQVDEDVIPRFVEGMRNK